MTEVVGEPARSYQPSAIERMVRSGVVERTGWLIPLLVLSSLLALGFQWATPRLPNSYDWYRPFEIVGERLERPGTLTIFGLVWLAGKFRLRGTLDRAHIERWLCTREPLGAKTALRLMIVVALFVGGALMAMQRFPFPTDHLAIGALVAGTAFSPNPVRLVRRVLAQCALGCFAFALVSHAFSVLKANLFLSTEPQDAWIVALETELFGRPPHQVLGELVQQSRLLSELLDQVYFGVFEHMIAVSIFLTALGRGRERAQFISALTVSYLVGGLCYYLLPTLGPVFMNPGNYQFLLDYELQTAGAVAWLKHNHTMVRAGAALEISPYAHIAAMPSLHVGHELVMLWYARHSRLMALVALAYLVLTGFATLALGWHYSLDLVGGALLALICVLLARRFDATTLPARWNSADPPLPARRSLRALLDDRAPPER